MSIDEYKMELEEAKLYISQLENENTRQITNQVEIQNDKSDDLDVNYA